jgi:hypothetical protein
MLLTWGYGWESALERLKDVFRIGAQGQAYRDFLEAGRKQGKSEAEIVSKAFRQPAFPGQGSSYLCNKRE